MGNFRYSDEDLIDVKSSLKIDHKGEKCFIYTRVSTEKQVTEGDSLEAQRQALYEYAKMDNMQIVGEYSDAGKSGKSVEGRDDFLRMIEDAKAGKDGVKFVLVFKLSRFGRSCRDILFYLQELQDNGVNLICTADHIDSSDGTGKLMISIMGAMAEIERENILTQSMQGRLTKASKGGWNGGFLPWGYFKDEDGHITFEKDEEGKPAGDAAIVKEIFEMYGLQGMGADAIAKELNRRGVVKTAPIVESPKKARKHDFLTEFSRGHIVRILDSEFYKGTLTYGKRKNFTVRGKRGVTVTRKQTDYLVEDNAHEGIVSAELWETCHRRRLETGGKPEKKNPEHEYILSGLLKCPVCGSPMYGRVNRTKKRADGTPYAPYYYYQCKHQFGASGHSCEFKTQIGARRLDQQVRDIVCSLVDGEDFVDEMKSVVSREVDTDSLQEQLKTLKESLRVMEGKIRIRCHEKDNIDPDSEFWEEELVEVQTAIKELRYEKREIEKSIAMINDRIRNAEGDQQAAESIYQMLTYFGEVYDDMTDDLKKEFMQNFIERIEIYPEKQSDGRRIKEIVFNFPIIYNGEETTSLGFREDGIFPPSVNNCGDGCSSFRDVILLYCQIENIQSDVDKVLFQC